MTLDLFLRILPHWAAAFGMTLAVEVPIFVLLARYTAAKLKVPSCTKRRAALAGALGSCITHPLLWFVWPFVVRDYTAYIISGELLVAVIESLTFYLAAKPISPKRAAFVAVTANAASFGFGVLVYKVLGIE